MGECTLLQRGYSMENMPMHHSYRSIDRMGRMEVAGNLRVKEDAQSTWTPNADSVSTKFQSDPISENRRLC